MPQEINIKDIKKTNKKDNKNIKKNLDEDKDQNIMFDLNFYYRRMDKLITYIDDLNTKIDIKQEELGTIIDKVGEHLKSVDREKILLTIDENIETLDDLIEIAKKYGSQNKLQKYTIDTNILFNIIEPLEKLKNVIGLNDIKNQIVDQIITSLLDIYDEDIMFHTVIKGPPGVGKTMIAKILGELYLKMGILKSNDSNELKFITAKRSDLIGKFLGHTAIKTQELIDKCDGGVLFIDEVYSLGNPEKKDSFSKECIDTLNLNLTEKKNFICIIAGYEAEINECFFNYNPGLKRRFPFMYHIKDYTKSDLRKILISKLSKNDWKFDISIKDNYIDDIIGENFEYFKNYGGDIENLLLKIKIVHGRRVFGKSKDIRKIITKEDLEKGVEKLIQSKDKIIKDEAPFGMYM